MIESVYNLLDEEYVEILLDQIDKKEFDSPNFCFMISNYYNRHKMTAQDEFKRSMESFLYQKYNKRYLLKDNGFWINKITTESNKDDDFHVDESDLSIVTYLNDEFEGGEFEYINSNDEKIKITPKRGLSVIIHSKVQHRVLPVTSGVRYSCVSFFEYLTKSKKTLL